MISVSRFSFSLGTEPLVSSFLCGIASGIVTEIALQNLEFIGSSGFLNKRVVSLGVIGAVSISAYFFQIMRNSKGSVAFQQVREGETKTEEVAGVDFETIKNQIRESFEVEFEILEVFSSDIAETLISNCFRNPSWIAKETKKMTEEQKENWQKKVNDNSLTLSKSLQGEIFHQLYLRILKDPKAFVKSGYTEIVSDGGPVGLFESKKLFTLLTVPSDLKFYVYIQENNLCSDIVGKDTVRVICTPSRLIKNFQKLENSIS